VKDWLEKVKPNDWKVSTIRHGTKGKIKAKLLKKHVWIWDKKSQAYFKWQLIARQNLDGTDLKLSISNAPQSTSARKLAYIQSQRHFVERAFQDAKSELGMASPYVTGDDGHVVFCQKEGVYEKRTTLHHGV